MEVEDRRLFIGNLPSGVDEQMIKSRFSKYGKVLDVEVKHRKANAGFENGENQDSEILSTFAFINISSNKNKLDICLRKLSRKKWDGHEIKIEYAKESILSKLERERKEFSAKEETNNCSSKDKIKDFPKAVDIFNGKPNNRKRIFSNDDFDDQEERLKDDGKFPSKNKKLHSENDDQRHQNNVERNSDSTIKNGFGRHDSSSPNATAEQRRLKSLEEKNKMLSQRKLAVKAALSSIDSSLGKNKIIFNDDDECSGNASKERLSDTNELEGGRIVTSSLSKEASKHLKSSTTRKENNNLFEDSDETDEEASSSRFEVKEHFDGKKGQKLLKLQTKYGNDSRFTLDQRFAESSSDEDNNDDCLKVDKRKHLEKDKEAAEEESDRMSVDDKYEDEVRRQLEILQNVVGQQIIKPQAEESKSKKQKPAAFRENQLCVRFDPTIAEHEQFIVKPPAPGSEIETKTSKKKKKKSKDMDEEINNEEEQIKSDMETSKSASNIEVSKETYYEVVSDLKERLKSSGTGFSLNQLFSSDDRSNKDNSKETEDDTTKFSKKLDDRVSSSNKPVNEDGVLVESEKKGNSRLTSQSRTSALSSLWKESFFFKTNDERFKESAEFFMQNDKKNNCKDFSDRRKELKLIVKKKIKRNIQNDDMFKKKIGGGFPSKNKKFSKKR